MTSIKKNSVSSSSYYWRWWISFNLKSSFQNRQSITSSFNMKFHGTFVATRRRQYNDLESFLFLLQEITGIRCWLKLKIVEKVILMLWFLKKISWAWYFFFVFFSFNGKEVQSWVLIEFIVFIKAQTLIRKL